MGGLFSFGEEAFGGDGVSLHAETLADAMTTGTLPSVTNIRVSADAAMVLDETILGIDLPNLSATIALTGSAAAYTTLRNSLSDRGAFGEALSMAWTLLVQENLALAGAATGNRFLLGAIIDVLHASGTAASRLDAVAAVSAALAMESLVANGWSLSAVDSVAFNEALTAAAQFVGPLADSAAMIAGATNSMRIVVLGTDAIAAADGLTGLLSMFAEASDSLVLYATINLGGTEYAGWALNTANKAPSQYTNMPFESLVVFDGRAFGSGEGGLFELTGDTDEGADIAARVRTGLMGGATLQKGRVPDVYYGITGAGEVVLKVISTSDNGETEEDWYVSDTDARTGNGPREAHVEVGRGIKSRLFGLELHNKAGGSLDITGIEWRRIILDRRK